MLENEVNDLHQVFGIREEYDLSTLSRGMACDVYLARTDFSQTAVSLSILVVAEVTPGLSAACELIVSERVVLTMRFGQQDMGGDNTTDGTDEDTEDITISGDEKNCLESTSSLIASTRAFTVISILSCLVVSLCEMCVSCLCYYRCLVPYAVQSQ